MISYAGALDAGRRGKRNDDRWFADPAGRYFFVLDGMANSEAPELVAEILPHLLDKLLKTDGIVNDPQFRDRLNDVLAEVSDRVFSRMKQEGHPRLGCTIALTMIYHRHALIAHLGDCRVYQYRQPDLQALTRDHSFVQDLINQGRINEEQARKAKKINNQLYKFFGKQPWGKADMRVLELAEGDRLLLCTDGLSDSLDEGEIKAAFEQDSDPQETCQTLIGAVRDKGRESNIAVMVVVVS